MATRTTSEHRTFCRICLATCGTIVTVEDGGRVVSVRGDETHPVSQGYVCPKGRALPEYHHSPQRLDGALVRGSDGQLRATSIDDGHADLAIVLQRVVAESGPGAIGVFLGTGSFMDPAGGWAARRLMAALPTDHRYSTATVDAVAKTLVASLMAGTTVLIPQPDLDDTRLLVLLGINPVVSHGHATPFADPIGRIRAAKRRGEVYVVDPRRTESARLATHHLAPRPGSDYALLGYAVRALLSQMSQEARTALDARASGVDALTAIVARFDTESVCAVTGLSAEQLDGFVASVERAGRLSLVTGTGSTMTANANLTEWMAWALLVVTDSFDHPGGMWFNPGVSLRLDRRPVLPSAPPERPGSGSRPDIARCGDEWPAALIPSEVEAGRLRALIVVGGNIALALPDPQHMTRAFEQIDALVVLETHHTATTEWSTHSFACADQLERADLMPLELNTSPIYQQHTDPVVPGSPSRPPLWQTLARIGQHVGVDVLPAGMGDPATVTTDAVLSRMARGTSVDELREAGGLRIEAPAMFDWVTPRLPLGSWQLAPAALVAQLETVDTATSTDSLVLTPRRLGKRMNSQPFRDDRADVWLHPVDAERSRVRDGDLAEVRSSVGSIVLPVKVTDSIARGAASVVHSWGASNVNELIGSHDIDPLTGMARLAAFPVTVRPAPSPQ